MVSSSLYDFYSIHLAFQNFMIEKGYEIRERESLISPIFPTTFTLSGGPDLAYKFWGGDSSIRGNHIVNQPCIRHWDIESTGDGKHLSFFNMFVADSVGGYSRKEVVSHFMEFFTEYLFLDKSRFYASYFTGGNVKGKDFREDSEMKEIWLDLGIDESKIIGFGEDKSMEAFVANSVEPVGGPRTELFYDMRDKKSLVSSVEEFMELEKKGAFLEFFTHVLYNLRVEVKENEFSFEEMSDNAVAAGFGPQRMLRIIEGVSDIGNISVFDDLKQCLGEFDDGFHREAVISCDHVRGLVFLINDGVLDLSGTKNNSRKYLFRKYMKNFKQNFEKIPLQDHRKVLSCLIDTSINMFSILFPEFKRKKEFIFNGFMKAYERY